MTEQPRPFSAEHPSTLPLPPGVPFDVVIVGAGRVGSSFAAALRRAGHSIIGELGRSDDPGVISRASVVVISVPDDALFEASGVVARLARPGAVVVHTCGIQGLLPLADCGPLVAAIHPALPIARKDQPLEGVAFGVTCPVELRAWCERFVGDLGGSAHFVTDEQRVLYHAALCMASNFTASLAGDAAELLEGHELLIPLLRATVENLGVLGPDAALTGPVVRGDSGTVRAHLAALPPHLLDVYISNARRVLARAVDSGRLGAEDARAIEEAFEAAMAR